MGTDGALGDRPADRPESAAGMLAAARAERRTADQAEARLCRLAVEWVVMHPGDGLDEAATYVDAGGNQTGLSLAGPGAPAVAEYAVAEFAAAVGLATEAGKWFLGECLELRYRLPRHWHRLTAGRLPAWKARRVARETMRLSAEAAGFVDAQVAPVAGRIKPAQLDRTVHEAIGRYMPAEVDRLAAASWDKRHVTVHEQLVSFTGTMTVEAELDIADALDLETAVAAGAQLRAALGSTEPWDVRRAQAVGDLARGQYPLDLHPDNSQQDGAAGAAGEVGAVGADGADGADAGRRVPRVRRVAPRSRSSTSEPGAAGPIPAGWSSHPSSTWTPAPKSTPTWSPTGSRSRSRSAPAPASSPGAPAPPGPVTRRPGRPSLRPRPRRAESTERPDLHLQHRRKPPAPAPTRPPDT